MWWHAKGGQPCCLGRSCKLSADIMLAGRREWRCRSVNWKETFALPSDRCLEIGGLSVSPGASENGDLKKIYHGILNWKSHTDWVLKGLSCRFWVVDDPLRGLPSMTSALEGGRGVVEKWTTVLISCVIIYVPRKGEGVKIPKFSPTPLMEAPRPQRKGK